MDEEQAETEVGPANDETEIVVDHDAVTQLGQLAWSQDQPLPDLAEPERRSWGAWGRAGVMVSIGVAVAIMIGVGAYVAAVSHDDGGTMAPTTAAAAPTKPSDDERFVKLISEAGPGSWAYVMLTDQGELVRIAMHPEITITPEMASRLVNAAIQ